MNATPEFRPPRADLGEYTDGRGGTGAYADGLDVDVLIVGAGFGGIYCLYELRKAGFSTLIYDAGAGFGGTWQSNTYPGARVDSPVPVYELAIPEVYKDFHWLSNYPDRRELQRYFEHVDAKLDLKRDCSFNTVVVSAEFDCDIGKWHVRTSDGRHTTCRFFILATGLASKRYTPKFADMDTFEGDIYHSASWPAQGVEWAGKRVAVIGTGASGVQMIQEMASDALSLAVFQRTPNLALPMLKRELSKEEQDAGKLDYARMHAEREDSFSGYLISSLLQKTFDDQPKDRERVFEKLWGQGGFSFLFGGYSDVLVSAQSNREAYNFWRKKQSNRVADTVKKELLFPEEPPHAFGVKRPSLETNFYEALDQDHVEIVDIGETSGRSIQRFTPRGIVTSDGIERKFDIVALATGFDAVTGGITNIDIKSVHGTYLKDAWRSTVKTYLGITITGYPNLFQLFGAQSPTMYTNAPTILEIQGRWIRDAIVQVTTQGLKYINPTPQASESWKKMVDKIAGSTLFPTAPSSAFMGGNVPGKPIEIIPFIGGIARYASEIQPVLENWEGFEVVKGYEGSLPGPID